MRHIQGVDRNQSLMFPELVDDYIKADNPVRFIDAYVDSLDLAKLGFTHATTKDTGREPYNPGDLLKLYIYGYLNKTRSSRQLETATHRNIELFWLLRKLHPDFKTIADFRKDNTKAIKQVCREFTLLCKKLDLFGGELVAIDGSKFSAVNHNGRAYTQKKIALILQEIDEKIDAYLKGLDQQDQVETKIHGLSAEQLQEKIANLKTHRAEVENIQAQLAASGQSQITLTDPDSRLMHSSSQGTDVSYNVQIATDAKHKLIAVHEVTNDCDDSQQLANIAIQAKEILGVESLDATGDKGYYNEEKIKECDNQNINCYVPKPERSQNKKRGLYTKQDFQYDAVNDCYICPAKQELTFRYETIHQNKMLRFYEGVVCRDCPLRSQCTGRQAGNRRLSRWIHEHVIEAMQQRMRQHPDKAALRKALVEHPFGTIKHWMNQGHFLLRGIEKVGAEMSLSVLAYNMKRVINILGVKELIQAVA